MNDPIGEDSYQCSGGFDVDWSAVVVRVWSLGRLVGNDGERVRRNQDGLSPPKLK